MLLLEGFTYKYQNQYFINIHHIKIIHIVIYIYNLYITIDYKYISHQHQYDIKYQHLLKEKNIFTSFTTIVVYN